MIFGDFITITWTFFYLSSRDYYKLRIELLLLQSFFILRIFDLVELVPFKRYYHY